MVDISGTASPYGHAVGFSYLSGRTASAQAFAQTTEASKPAENRTAHAAGETEPTQATEGGRVRTTFSLRGFAAAGAVFQFRETNAANLDAQLTRGAPQLSGGPRLNSLLQGEIVRFNPLYSRDAEGQQEYLDQVDKRAANGTDKAELEVKRLLKSLGLPTDISLEFNYNSYDDQTVSIDSPDLTNSQRQRLSNALNSERGDKVNNALSALKSQVSVQRSEHATVKALGELEPEDPEWTLVEKQLAYFAYEQRASEIDHGATTTGEVDRSRHNFSFSFNEGELSAHFIDGDGEQRGVLDFKDPAEIPPGKPGYTPWFYAHDPSLTQQHSPIGIARA